MGIKKAKIKFYFLIALLAAIAAISILFHLIGYNFDIYNILGNLQNNKLIAFIYISLYLISSFFPLPFLTFIGAFVFPFRVVFIYALIGNIVSFIVMFFLTRWLGREYVDLYEQKNERVRELDIKLSDNAFKEIILLRFFYFLPPEFVNILAGLSKVKFEDYILASIIGKIPVLLASIGLIKAYQLQNLGLLIASAIALLLLALIPLLLIRDLKKYFKKSEKK